MRFLRASIFCASFASVANSSDVVNLVKLPKFYSSPETESIDVLMVPLLSFKNSLSDVNFFLNSLSSSNLVTSCCWSRIWRSLISSEARRSLSFVRVWAFRFPSEGMLCGEKAGES